MGSARLSLAIEEHGQGKQMLRFRVTPNFKIRRTRLISVFVLLFVFAFYDHAWPASLMFAGIAAWLVIKMLTKCSFAKEAIMQALDEVKGLRCTDESTTMKELVK
jgi:hypothetical protein